MKSSLQRAYIGVLALLLMAARVPFAGAQNKNKPLSEQEILDLVQNFVPSEKIIELVHQFGIGFEPDEKYLGRLHKAGAKKDLIETLRSMKPARENKPAVANPPPEQSQAAHAGEPLSQQQITSLLSNGIPSGAVVDLVTKYGINFEPNQEMSDAWKKAGAEQSLLTAIQKAKRFPAPKPPANPEPRQVAKEEPKKQEPAPAPKQEVKAVEPPAPVVPEHQGPYKVGGEVSPPQALYAPSAPYTEQARKARIQGTVVLGIVINDHGKVTDITVISKPLGQGLEESAVKAVATWVFRPAQFRGNPVPVRVNVQVNFQLQN